MLSPILLSPSISYYITFIFSLFISLHCGTLYAYSAISTQISSILNDKHVAIIGAIGDIGFFSSIIMGYCYYNYGPIVTFLISTILVTLGWYLPFLYYNFTYWCLMFFFIGLGSGGLQVSIITINADNFNTKYRGIVIGTLMCGVGVSGVLWTLIYQYILKYNLYRIFMILGTSSLIVGILGVLFIQSNLNNTKPLPTGFKYERRDTFPYITGFPQPALLDSTTYIGKHRIISDVKEELFIKADINSPELFKKRLFWLLFVTVAVNSGIALSWKNHMGAFGLDPDATVQIVLIFVVSTAATRFVIGFLSDFLIGLISRPLYIIFASFVSTIGMTCFVVIPNYTTLYIATISLSFCYSCIMVINSQLMTICFGVLNYGINNGYICLGIVIGSFSITTITTFFHKYISSLIDCSHDPMLCYRYPILFSLALSLCPLVLSFVIWHEYPPKWLIPHDQLRKEYYKVSADQSTLDYSNAFEDDESDNLIPK